MRGMLYIHFSINFPESGTLTTEQLEIIEDVLPQRSLDDLTEMELDECEDTMLLDVNIDDEMRRKQQQQQHEAYEEEEDDYNGGPRAQCAQQ